VRTHQALARAAQQPFVPVLHLEAAAFPAVDDVRKLVSGDPLEK